MGYLAMKCKKCNQEITTDSRFCSYCGEKIKAESSLELTNKIEDYTRKIYFVLGMNYGMYIENPKDKQIAKVYNKLREEFSEEIDSIVNFLKNATSDKPRKE
jgi:predicted amidophosphoribosyltransferase